MRHKGSVYLYNICSVHYVLGISYPCRARDTERQRVIRVNHFMPSAFVSGITSSAHEAGLASFVLWLGPRELGGNWRKDPTH